MQLSQGLCLLLAVVRTAAIPARDNAAVPSVLLSNAALPGTMMPATGLGTGGYGRYYLNGSEVTQAVLDWLSLGGRRIDTSLSYHDQPAIGTALAQSNTSRAELFITSKVGPFDTMGYNDSLTHFADILSTLGVSYVDLLLIHWPGPGNNATHNSTDPLCHGNNADPRGCRQSTWKALERIYNEGGARAIGVSNFEAHHLQDILDLESRVPAVNQVEYHPYWHEDDLVSLCHAHNIVFNSYSPIGAPDISPARNGWRLLDDVTMQQIAQEHDATVAQISLAWQWQRGIIANPRTKNPTHMRENLSYFGISLSQEEVAKIDALKAPTSNPKICPDPNNIP